MAYTPHEIQLSVLMAKSEKFAVKAWIMKMRMEELKTTLSNVKSDLVIYKEFK